MRMNADQIVFTFTPDCECGGIVKHETTMNSLIEGGNPMCGLCEEEFILEEKAEIKLSKHQENVLGDFVAAFKTIFIGE